SFSRACPLGKSAWLRQTLTPCSGCQRIMRLFGISLHKTEPSSFIQTGPSLQAHPLAKISSRDDPGTKPSALGSNASTPCISVAHFFECGSVHLLQVRLHGLPRQLGLASLQGVDDAALFLHALRDRSFAQKDSTPKLKCVAVEVGHHIRQEVVST